MRIHFCNAPYGVGGIGQHFSQLVEESRQQGLLKQFYAPGSPSQDPKHVVVSDRTYGLLSYTPIRFSPSWCNHVSNELFDRRLSWTLSRMNDSLSGTALMGFVGKSLHTFEAGRQLGAGPLELVAANSHVDRVRDRHARAGTDSGIQDTWLNGFQLRKTMKEYALADRIYVHSEYVRESFLEAGYPEDTLIRSHLAVAPRFEPPTERPSDDPFRLVYVGRVEATKGITLLMEAFEQLPIKNAELTIVGGWSSRTMRRYMEERLARDPRLCLAPGDPLPHLQAADVFVHPSYEDGFGYAPMEALACGVPVVVTTDTGMKEYVRDGENGFVVPTGTVAPIIDAVETIYRSPLAATTSLLPPAYYDQLSPDVLSTSASPTSLLHSSFAH